MRIISSFLLACLVFDATAQSATPAPAQKGAILIIGATAHIGNGSVIQNSALAFDAGKITLIADATVIRLDQSKFSKIYDASGKHVYPGFIATNSQLGLVEIEAVRSTNDDSESGSLNPNARAIIAYNSDSEVSPTVRSNGILLAQTTPNGGTISGSSSAVQLDAWNWEDAVINIDEGIHLNWPAPRPLGGIDTGTPEQKVNDKYAQEIQQIRQYFTEARAYSKVANQTVKNPRFEAMRNLFTGKQTIYLHTDAAKTIQEGVLLAEEFGLKIVLVGGSDAWQVIPFLQQHKVAVVLSSSQRLPRRDDEDVDQPYKTPKALNDAGITFAISDRGSWKQRNLGFQAGQAVGAGLPYEAAVQAITQSAAKILGIDKDFGTLELGKSATLFISEGDALDMRTCKVTAAFIQGREINLDNKQKELSRKFEEKYKRQ